MEKGFWGIICAGLLGLGSIAATSDERVEGCAEWVVMQTDGQVVFKMQDDPRWFTFQHGTFCHARARPTCEDLGYDSYTNLKAGKRVLFRAQEGDSFLVPITSPALMQRF